MRRLVAWTLLLVGCSDPPLQEASRYFELHHDGAQIPCGGTLPAMDRYVEDLRAEFGLAPPALQEFKYVWTDADIVADRCGGPASGCVNSVNHTIYAEWLPHNHEIVHAAALPFDRGPRWLSEGLAMAYQGSGNEGDPFGRIDALALVRENRSDLPGDRYLSAGAWVRHLVDRYGVERVADLHAALSRTSRERTVDEAFVALFGASLAEVAAEFADRFDGCPLAGMSFNLWECGAPLLEWDDEALTLHRTLDCAQDDVVGPYAGALAFLIVTLDVDRAGVFDVTFDATLSSDDAATITNGLLLARCTNTCEDALSEAFEPGDERALFLEPGRYFLRVNGPSTAATQFAVTMARVNAE